MNESQCMCIVQKLEQSRKKKKTSSLLNSRLSCKKSAILSATQQEDSSNDPETLSLVSRKECCHLTVFSHMTHEGKKELI